MLAEINKQMKKEEASGQYRNQFEVRFIILRLLIRLEMKCKIHFAHSIINSHCK